MFSLSKEDRCSHTQLAATTAIAKAKRHQPLATIRQLFDYLSTDGIFLPFTARLYSTRSSGFRVNLKARANY
jgi:hypothetical protein